MVKERESELRHLGGKALHQMHHSSCIKKLPAARHKEAHEFDILSDLKSLSDEADQLAVKKLPKDPMLTEWFAAMKKTMESIRDCKSVNDVQYPSGILTFISTKDKEENVSTPAAGTTPAKEVSLVNKTIASSVPKRMTPVTKMITPENMPVTSDTQIVTPTTSVRKKVNPFVLMHQLTRQELNAHSNEKSLLNNIKTPHVMQSPVLNRTFEKINMTVNLDSGSVKLKNQSNIVSSCNDSGIMTRSGSRKKKENECLSPNIHTMKTRSGSKRKSSDTKNTSSKKKKMDSCQISSATISKKAHLRHPLQDLKASVMSSENKNKLSSIIKPPVKQKQSVVSKEQQILEEIKKKEKKIQENMQRIMTERQLKAEQNKKAREEKRTKTLQKRLQMEKEKEEKREMESKKSQVKVNKENPKKTTRAKELVEQHVKESKSSLIISSTQSTSNHAEALPKTPVINRKSEEIESYELTPVPDSSTYNFSDDDDDEKTANKRIPLWAQGVHLKSALMQQFYYPVNTDELFGSVIESPNLAEIFKINKKRYFKRTSSAIWNTTPDRSYYI